MATPPDPIEARLAGALSGQTEEGSLTPIDLAFTLLNQDAHAQLTATVAPTDVDKEICLPQQQGPPGTQQTMLLIKSDLDVQVKLNDIAQLTFALEAGGALVIPGQPEITNIKLTGIAATQAKVFITKIIGTSDLPIITPSPGGGGGSFVLDKFTATAGQTVFTLSQTPADVNVVLLFVEGVEYSPPVFFTVVGTTLTWLDVPFTMPLNARVEAFYQ